jgi:hypothetical protein
MNSPLSGVIIQKPTDHYHVHKDPPLAPFLSQFTLFDAVSLRCILILSFHLGTDLSNDILPLGVSTKILF